MVVLEPDEGIGHFVRAQVLPLPVVDDLVDQSVFRAKVANDAGNFVQTREFGRAVAAFAVNNTVLLEGRIPTDRDRFLHLTGLNRFRELAEWFLVEVLSRLVGVGLNLGQLDEKGAGQPPTSLLLG